MHRVRESQEAGSNRYRSYQPTSVHIRDSLQAILGGYYSGF